MLRSKTKVLNHKVTTLKDLPEWGFDGSSTMQAEGHSSDCPLIPVKFVPDPIRGAPHLLVMCEVMKADGSVHPSNTRAALRELAVKYKKEDPWFGIEQEYTFLKEDGRTPFAWPEDGGEPGPQGPYYCSVGTGRSYGRDLVEDHLAACIDAGLHISGINGEVMPGQWEFQVGTLGALDVSDELWIARWLLHRLSEEYGIVVSLSPKPKRDGDWNGAGAHTNFSTKSMRMPGGRKVINAACEKFAKMHKEHIAVYGDGNEHRLTGKHETCSINEFRYGESDRGASIRIPIFTVQHGYGYLEDRRPAANMDPYQVCARIIKTVCD